MVLRKLAHENKLRQRSMVECVDSVGDIKPVVIVTIEQAGFTDKVLCEIRVDLPVAISVCDSKSTA